MKAIAVLGLICLLSSAAQAQSTDLQRVEISGQPKLRYDVIRACPSMASQLERYLTRHVIMEGIEGLVRVEFSLDDERKVDVVSKGRTRVYASPIRRAVRSVDCLSAEARSGERFAFEIQFRREADDDSPDAPQRVALHMRQH